MVLRLCQHNIGYTADGFYRSDDPTNSVKALKEAGWLVIQTGLNLTMEILLVLLFLVNCTSICHH